jgi:asparagine synthase (glutamine-hydrolysing)
MCGLAGYLALSDRVAPDREILARMLDRLAHRGPDATGMCVRGRLALGFRRLSIIDPEHSPQPIDNEDGSIVLACNGEVFDYRALRQSLRSRGHVFRTNGDVETLLHLYEERGDECFGDVNGQFAVALYDFTRERLLLARDHVGICPLFVFQSADVLVFASEIKAVLQHPLVSREVDVRGLDQIFTLPALVSPLTMFRGIRSLRHGACLTVEGEGVSEHEYWDIDYPHEEELAETPHGPAGGVEAWAEPLLGSLRQAVARRLQADVDVGVYLSGGLDSGTVAALMRDTASGARRHAFSVSMPGNKVFCESRYQRLAAQRIGGLVHHEIAMDDAAIVSRLRQAVRHAEAPLRETYDTASLALSERARATGVPVVLCGEGADELFAGYAGYVTDYHRRKQPAARREIAGGDDSIGMPWEATGIVYHACGGAARATRAALYSPALRAALHEAGPAPMAINPARLEGRHPIHQRSYLDIVIRLSGHLLADHGDRMAMANGVEARYPFLDRDVMSLATRIPPALKFDGVREKAVLRKAVEGVVPEPILRRSKFPFTTPGMPDLLRLEVDWIDDLLSPERIRRDGYFAPEAIGVLRDRYRSPDFQLDVSAQEDWLLLVITFGMWLDEFEMPQLG